MVKQMSFGRDNLYHIKARVQERTGVSLVHGREMEKRKERRGLRLVAFGAACALCLFTTAAFTYSRLSSIKGDEVGFSAAYQGDGKYDIVVVNSSDKVLKLQGHVKVMQWSTGEPAEGNGGKIRLDGEEISPHSTGIVHIDLSEGYDVETMQERLGENDWYYFVLTNNEFAFGQDWMCSFGFEEKTTELAKSELYRLLASEEDQDRAVQITSGTEKQKKITKVEEIKLPFEEWENPVAELVISGQFHTEVNGTEWEGVTMAGQEGDEIYAVCDGSVSECGFAPECGNYLILSTEDGATVFYGHLMEWKAEEGDRVSKGETIARMGKTGMATGSVLSFSVSVDGECVQVFESF